MPQENSGRPNPDNFICDVENIFIGRVTILKLQLKSIIYQLSTSFSINVIDEQIDDDLKV